MTRQKSLDTEVILRGSDPVPLLSFIRRPLLPFPCKWQRMPKSPINNVNRVKRPANIDRDDRCAGPGRMTEMRVQLWCAPSSALNRQKQTCHTGINGSTDKMYYYVEVLVIFFVFCL